VLKISPPKNYTSEYMGDACEQGLSGAVIVHVLTHAALGKPIPDYMIHVSW
jgi:hypothetical protein